MSSKSKQREQARKLVADVASDLELAHPVTPWGYGAVFSRAFSLLEEAWELRSEDPVAAEDLARQALEVLDQGHLEDEHRRNRNDLKARAWIYLANFRRIRSDFVTAEDWLGRAEELLQTGTHQPQERARLLLIRAALFGDLRRMTEALDLMDQVIAIYRWADDRIQLARAFLTKSHLLHTASDLDGSLECLEQAEELVEQADDPWLVLTVKQHRLLHLCETDQARAGLELLPEVLRLANQVGNRLDRVRVQWAKGLLEGKLGRVDAAEETLREVRQTFLEDKIHNDVAQVTLDLAVVLLEAGRLRETRELAEEMLPLFESLDIRREAFAALILFHRAALQEKATADMVRDIAAFVKRTGNTPALKYEEPS